MYFNRQFQNLVGMDEPLVDSEGYPRNDIDVYRVRHARHRIICKLQNFSLAIFSLLKKQKKSLIPVYKFAGGLVLFHAFFRKPYLS